MKLRKTLSLLLTISTAATLMVGCGTVSNSAAATTSSAAAASTTATAPAATSASATSTAVSSESTTSANGDYSQPAHLDDAEFTFYQYSVENNDNFQKAIDLYEKTHSNIKINLESVGGTTDWRTTLKAKISSGDEPTIVLMDGPNDFDTFGDMLDDLSDQPWVSHIYDNFKASCMKDNKVIALPAATVCYGIIYNKDIFKACGIDGDSLRSYDAIDQAFSTVQQKIKNGDLKDQFPDLEAVLAFPGKITWPLSTHASNLPMSLEFNTAMDAYDAKTIDFKYADQFKDYIDLLVKYTGYADNPSALNAIDYDQAMGGSFCVEKTAAIQMGQWVEPLIAQVDSSLLDKIGVLPMPMKGVKENSICMGVGSYLIVNKNSTDAQRAAAKDFLNWLYMSDDGKKIVTQDLGFASVFDNYDNYPVNNAITQACQVYQKEGNVFPLVFGGYPDGWTDSLGSDLQGYIAGAIDWNTVINNAKQNWANARK